MLAALREEIGLEIVDISVAELAQAAADIQWTRNPFHRLIVAHAIASNTPLITANKTILANLPLAVWD